MACVTTARFAEDHAEMFLFAPCEASSSRGAFFFPAVFSGTLLRAFSSPRVDATALGTCSEVPRERAPNEFGARRSSTSFASDDARARERSATRRDETRRATSDARARVSDADAEDTLGGVFVFIAQASDGPSSDACASETEAWETSCSSEAARAGIGRTSPPARAGRVTPVRSFGVCPRAGAAARAAGRDDCPSTRMSRRAFSSASRPA